MNHNPTQNPNFLKCQSSIWFLYLNFVFGANFKLIKTYRSKVVQRIPYTHLYSPSICMYHFQVSYGPLSKILWCIFLKKDITISQYNSQFSKFDKDTLLHLMYCLCSKCMRWFINAVLWSVQLSHSTGLARVSAAFCCHVSVSFTLEHFLSLCLWHRHFWRIHLPLCFLIEHFSLWAYLIFTNDYIQVMHF